MTAAQKNLSPSQIIQKKTTTKREEGRSLGLTPHSAPFSRNVATNIGKKLFTLLSACFPANNKVHKIINKNTINLMLSCSCMNNIKQSIANHNKAILSKEKIKEEQIKICNCRNRTLCPLQGNCLQKGLVYQATVTQTNTMREDIYIGIIENEFKTRYNQHSPSFRLSHKSSATSLSEHIWKLKENNTDHAVTWRILEKYSHTRQQPVNATCAQRRRPILPTPTLL